MARSRGQRSPYEKAVASLRARTRKKEDQNLLWKSIIDPTHRPTNDASLALVLGAAVEQALEIALRTYFVLNDQAAAAMFDDEGNGPLSTFASKIRMGYALGIYESYVRNELGLIHHIRNNFAHSKQMLDFTDPIIVDACGLLYLPKKWKLPYLKDAPAPQEKYVISAQFLFLYLEDPRDPTPKSYKTHPAYDMLLKAS
jgi:DNA-binding MltR family transcriptional regulator